MLFNSLAVALVVNCYVNYSFATTQFRLVVTFDPNSYFKKGKRAEYTGEQFARVIFPVVEGTTMEHAFVVNWERFDADFGKYLTKDKPIIEQGTWACTFICEDTPPRITVLNQPAVNDKLYGRQNDGKWDGQYDIGTFRFEILGNGSYLGKKETSERYFFVSSTGQGEE